MPRKRTPKPSSGHNPRRSGPGGSQRGGWTPGHIKRLMVNPFYAITVDPVFCAPHESMMSREAWISVNARLIREEGPEVYLTNLLQVLEGDFLTGAEGEMPFGFMDAGDDAEGPEAE